LTSVPPYVIVDISFAQKKDCKLKGSFCSRQLTKTHVSLFQFL
jgi:hypothetical protein